MSSLGPTLDKAVKGSLLHDINLSDMEQQICTAITIFGALVATLFSSGPVNRFGARKVLRFTNLFWIAGGVLCFFPNLYTLIAGRFLLGLGVGTVSSVSPVLLSEIATDDNRGMVCSFHQLQITVGILFSGIFAYGMVTYVEHGWRYVTCFPVVAVLLLLLDGFIPNSPIWLVKNGHMEEVKSTISLLRFSLDITKISLHSINRKNTTALNQSSSFIVDPVTSGANLESVQIAVDDEIHKLQQLDQRDRAENSEEATWAEVFSPQYSKIVIMGFAIMAFQVWSGVNAVIFYSTKIFAFAGVKEAILGTVSVALVNVIITIIGLWGIEKLGRKILITGGCGICGVALLSLAAALLLGNDHPSIQSIVSVSMLLLFIAAFAPGLGSTSWVVLTEMTPARIRSKAFSAFVVENWIFNLLIALFTLSMINGLGGGSSDEQQKKGVGYLFLIFGSVCILGFFCLLKWLPETKGLTPETIIEIMDKKSSGHGHGSFMRSDKDDFDYLPSVDEV